MKPLILKLRKCVLLDATVCVLCIQFADSSVVFAETLPEIVAAEVDLTKLQDETYTINFQNISMVEYVKFVSKIAGVNFIFDERDIQFPVTIISEEPVTVKNIMSMMIQVLRIHDLFLLEQENNLVISRNSTVNQISTIVSSDLPEVTSSPPIVTRVFRLKNASPNSVATVIRPMTSSSAIIEISAETRQLIVTDITTNVDKISQLLASLDAPHTHLEIDSYVVKHISPNRLIELVTQIVQPFADGNALIFVPQLDTNTIFIVSTPSLIERSLMVMQDLDVPSKEKIGGEVSGPPQIFLYKIQTQPGPDLVKALKNIAKSLSETPVPPTRLIKALDLVTWIPESNSLLISSDSETIDKVKEILSHVDGHAVSTGVETLYIYKTRNEYRDRIQHFLNQIVSNLDESQPENREIIRAIKNSKWIETTQSFLFQGSPQALAKIRELLTGFEVQENLGHASQQTFFIYELKYADGAFVLKSLDNLAQKLQDSNSPDIAFLQTIKGIKWLKENNSLLITGPHDSVEKVKQLIAQFDTGYGQSEGTVRTLGKQTFLIYKVQNISPEKLMDLLKEVARDLKSDNVADKDLQRAIQQMKWLKDNNAIYFSGYEQTLQRIDELLKKFDVPQGEEGSSVYVYDLKYSSGDKVIFELKNISAKLKKLPNPNLTLIRALDNVTWIEKNNSLLITSTPDVIDQIKVIVGQFDIPTTGRVSGEKTSFLMYKPQYRTVQELDASLKAIYQNLKHSGLVDPDLLEALSSVQAVSSTQSLLFTGTPEALDKVKQLLERIDAPGKGISSVENITFLIYNVQHVTPEQLLASLKAVAVDMQSSNLSDKAVAQSIMTAKIIPENNTILFTGSTDTLKQVDELIKQFDRQGAVALRPHGAPLTHEQVITQIAQGMREPVSTFAIYKPQYVNGEHLIVIFQDFKKNLKDTNVVDQKLFDAIDNLRWIPKTSSLLISGDPQAIKQIEDLLKKFDVPSVASSEAPAEALFTQATNFLVFKLQYQRGDEIQTAIKKIGASLLATPGEAKEPLTEAITSMQWIEVTNSLLASGDAESLQKIKHLIENLDIPLKQVLIEVLVIETTLINSQSFGLQWIAEGQYKNRLAAAAANVNAPPNPFTDGFQSVNSSVGPTPGNIPLLSGFDLGVIGNMLFHKGKSFATIGSLINAVQTDTDSTIIMNPKIVTQDNKSATIFIGRNIPFVGSVITSTIAEVNATTSLEYRNIGFSLTITPVLGDSELVSLEIVNEISTAPANPPATQAGQVNGITTTLNTMSTRVHVPNEHFLILSGMIQDTKDHNKVGIPCLGGLPIIGAAFSNNTRDAAKSNIIIFVRPHIINSYDDYRKVTEHQENLFKDVLPNKDLKEQFDWGVDLLKTYKDE